MPAGSGDLAGVSFTPSIDGVVAVLCTFKCSGIRSMGGSALARLFLEAGGVRSWGPYEVMLMRTDASFESLAFAIQARFVVAAGVPVYCGLWGEVTTGAAASWSDIDVTPALHKRGA
jgi:hypothetical protein